MALDFETLNTLRTHHPTWLLLRSDHAPLVASFLHRAFLVPNVRVMAASDMAEALNDTLYEIRKILGENAFPKSAVEYLNDWAAPEKGWLRKFYRAGTDEAQFDLTPSSEKALAWLEQLSERQFVGTESRLLMLFDLLKQLRDGTETNPDKRIAELQARRDQIDAEIAQVRSGHWPLLDDSAVKDRFQQFMQGARELLTDFREVEANFRQLDRSMRERIALWEGSKGKLLEEVFGERDIITDSDQGRSFRAFWEFLLSSRRQEELSMLLDGAMALPAVEALKPDGRLRRVHYDWLEAGENTQRTVAQLSEHLRRFLDDQAWLENRRIMDILRSIERNALSLRDDQPTGTIMEVAEPHPEIILPMERPLFTPPLKAVMDSLSLQYGDEQIDDHALFDQVVVDKGRLIHHIRRALQDRSQISLGELLETQPLQQGLAELLVYLQLGCDEFRTVVDDGKLEFIHWEAISGHGEALIRSAQLPQVIFVN
jgi:flagellar motility protein MotE (MotC chaperone)